MSNYSNYKGLRRKKLDISGTKGNTFVVLGIAGDIADQTGQDAKAIITEMKSGDYNNLLRVFNKHFGILVELVSPHELAGVDEDLYTIEPRLEMYI